VQAQSITDSTATKKEKKYQATAPSTQPFGKEAFAVATNTTIRWLGMAGFLVNSQGTTFMIDPLLEGYDMPLLMDFPIRPKDVPHLDAVFATHSDNDPIVLRPLKIWRLLQKNFIPPFMLTR
jgi:hypothetical protein